MKPVVDRLEEKYAGKVEFRLVNVDTDPEGSAMMQKYGAQYVPTFVLLNVDGSVGDQIVGEVEEAKLAEAIDRLK
ncbi:MAG: thioredoxin family protein [Actinomycetota bacterium]|nr:thioredoxin family protein [Actinomycetota bacterium]